MLDFQGANTLVDVEGRVKIADFGVSKQIIELTHSILFFRFQCLLCTVRYFNYAYIPSN